LMVIRGRAGRWWRPRTRLVNAGPWIGPSRWESGWPENVTHQWVEGGALADAAQGCGKIEAAVGRK